MTNYNTDLQSNNNELQSILDTINALPNAGSSDQIIPKISVDDGGLITATAGTKSSTYQLAFQEEKTITPGTTSQIAVPSGYYTGGDVMVAGDANLLPENIVSGKSIFGVSGSAQSGGDSYNVPSITLAGSQNVYYVDESGTRQYKSAASNETIYPVNGVLATTTNVAITTTIPYFEFYSKTAYRVYIFLGNGTVTFG